MWLYAYHRPSDPDSFGMWLRLAQSVSSHPNKRPAIGRENDDAEVVLGAHGGGVSTRCTAADPDGVLQQVKRCQDKTRCLPVLLRHDPVFLIDIRMARLHWTRLWVYAHYCGRSVPCEK
ncbi:uncharacterized protein MAM_07203 [Metarhizium album ARSEF 1941]|uniref:Uncharacterized protein n=1 Tax=Metarhizium album (strain ARSEF 1941) TaxID=1081103 RepID=A0A0B2WG57_METAS|nr:uncharacterized protein MAM_07203 [Metarhizium album ARSEF 1941]KHN94976.1 hypothetical protein MAM_07203 [Metarhizium album ARSEF 1941]